MRVLIFGAAGQDGILLGQLCTQLGWSWKGIRRGGPGDPLKDRNGLKATISNLQPDRIFFLAAYHRSSEEPEDQVAEWSRSYETHLLAWIRVLETVKESGLKSRLLYASSASIFGSREDTPCPQNEETSKCPDCAYGHSKAAAMEISREFSKKYELRISNAILYPHESIYRKKNFLSRKLLDAAFQAKRNPAHKIQIANLSATADWGYAPEYVVAMNKILDLPKDGDFILATGKESSVSEFAECIFSEVGLKWQNHIEENPRLLLKPKRRVVGDAKMFEKKTGQIIKVKIPELGACLVRDTLASLNKEYFITN